MLWQKEVVFIEGEKIVFVELPNWMMIGGPECKSLFTPAMCISHFPSKTGMIFVSVDECAKARLRYALYHEHIELLFDLEILQDQLGWEDRLEDALMSLNEDSDAVRQALLELSSDDPDSLGHIAALVLEASLAKREMCEAEWKLHLAEILADRL